MDFSQDTSRRRSTIVSKVPKVPKQKSVQRQPLPSEAADIRHGEPFNLPASCTTTTMSSSPAASVRSSSIPLSSTTSSRTSPPIQETAEAPKPPHIPGFKFSCTNQWYRVNITANSPNRKCRLPRRPDTSISEYLCSPVLEQPHNPTIENLLDRTLHGCCVLPGPAESLDDWYSNSQIYRGTTPRIPYRVKILVQTIDGLIEFLGIVSKAWKGSAEIFLDEEGNNHGKDGVLCTIQVTLGAMDTTTFVLDVIALGKDLFDTVGEDGTSIKSVLEDPTICKIFFDVRNDSAALYHQYGIELQGIIDIQIMELAVRSSRSSTYLWGLNACIDRYLCLRDEEQQEWSDIKILGRNYCGNDYSIWEKRPLPAVLLAYAANDTNFMPHLYTFFWRRLSSSPTLSHMVRVESARRVQESKQLSFVSSGSLAPSAFR